MSERDLMIHAHAMWKTGRYDTLQIAEHFDVPEWRIYNALAKERGHLNPKLELVQDERKAS